ncbi:hypothetical protein NJF44_15545 [Pseudomonas guariconensis]|uniref:hypothetical protein n=1 Tax=Pseudomonas TaxID=286 RepID=UPI00209802B4|nr:MULTISPECIES: hypothetical protein [Pseudomonas]MCO7516448.1 hypothetical protein [Pseudomonas putida]MCO7606652.1 hypothetical protein [Pseudomonas guariconensis]
MSRIQYIIFTEASLEHALSAVRALHDMSTELIAADVFRQISELTPHRTTPYTAWCGRSGLYLTRYDAVVNGEQQVAPAVAFGTAHLIDQGNVIAAEETANVAKREYSEAVQRAYPIGRILRADVGGHQITVEVTGHGAFWSRPGEIFGTNVKTGKARQFHHRHVLEVLP